MNWWLASRARSPPGLGHGRSCSSTTARADGSRALLRAAHERDPRFRVVLLKRNFGQHPAMAAGMLHARAGIVVTMDGDLQNDPDDICKLVAALEDNGVEVASGRRQARADALMSRKLPSRAVNGMLRRLTRVEISDYGCAFNAYRRSAFEPVLHRVGRQKFTKALILSTGASVVEVDLQHHAREGQASRYSSHAAPAARAARPVRLLAAADPVGRSGHRDRDDARVARARDLWRDLLDR